MYMYIYIFVTRQPYEGEDLPAFNCLHAHMSEYRGGQSSSQYKSVCKTIPRPQSLLIFSV